MDQFNIQKNQFSKIQDSLNNSDSIENQLNNEVSGLIKNPISSLLNRNLNKINTLTSNIEDKINKLSEDLVKSTDKKGRVELNGNIILITLRSKDVEEFKVQKIEIENKISSINSNINILSKTLKSLKTMQQSVRNIIRLSDIQEKVLSVNPTSGPIFSVFKKALKIVFLKDMLKEYSNVLSNELQNNTQKLDNLINRFSNLRIQIKISENDNIIDNYEAESEIISENLTKNQNNDVKTVTEEYEDIKNRKLFLKVEEYGNRKLIAKAYDKFSGLLIAQTSPSFISTSEELLEEIKEIVDGL